MADKRLPARTEAAVTELASRVTDRDRAVCRSLHEHRVLTVTQIRELHFDSLDRARKRLTQLHRAGVLARFRPRRAVGTSPYHYLLDELGAYLLAAERGIDPAELGWSRDARLRLATSQQLTHLIEASGFFTHLAYATRASGRGQLRTWWGQRRCTRAWGELIRPDGYAIVELDGHRVEVWVEWDRGTETHARLADKLDRYQELANALTRTVTLLLILPGDRRESEVRRRLQPDSASVRVLTSTAARHDTDPLAANWLELTGSTERRLTLTELPAGRGGQSIFSRQDREDVPADLYGSSAGPQHPDRERSQPFTYD